MKTERMIVLRKHRSGESDLVVHALNPSGMKLHLYARAAMKSKKRFGGGVLEPAHFIEAEWAPGRTPESLGTLLEARVLDSFEGLKTDYDRLNAALRLLHWVDRSSPGGEMPGVYNLLGNALRGLSEGRAIPALTTQFQLKFLWIHGVLEVEDWMGPYLSASLREGAVVQTLSAQQELSLKRALGQFAEFDLSN